MPIDITVVPFSCAGSWLRISALWPLKPGRVVIGTVRAHAKLCGGMNLWEIALLRNGREVSYECTATPSKLVLTDGTGRATFAFADPETIAFSASGVTLRFLPHRPAGTCIGPDDCGLLIGDAASCTTQRFRAGRGTSLRASIQRGTPKPKRAREMGTYVVDFAGDGATSGALRVQDHEAAWPDAVPTVTAAARERAAEWNAWLERMPPVPSRYRRAAELAWYINWSCIVNPKGAMTRRGVLMSKNWMVNVWSWDNCFNALALVAADPELAWGQIQLMFDHQADSGMLPDSVTDERAAFVYCKPPVVGWTVMRMIETTGIPRARKYLRQIYAPLERLTNWWYECRDSDGDGMCQYHHGNDSGWDNATAFDQGFPTEGADLAAHLVLQTEALGVIADAIGRPQEARAWRRRSHRQLRDLLEHSVRSGRFCSPLSGKHTAKATRSLLNCIPTVLGRRLPADILRNLVADLVPDGPFLTAYGPATESVDSPLHEPDGYWRGPVWAPSTFLIFDGLRDAGETALAREMARRFCDTCAAEPGMYENYNALTGQGLCDPAYTWTASVFILMANWLLEDQAATAPGTAD
jgi:glycogen debranching enzyme